jgi:crotonobetainyl-CoA dehydrogenase
MDFRITEDQELLLQSLEEHLQREAPENLMASLDDQKVFPYEPWKALADFGILALGVPEEYGGTPVDIMTMTLVTELLGREAFSLGIIYSLGVITIRDIVQFGSEEIKQKVLSGFVEGDAPVALGITEPQAGSDSAALKTSATFDGDDVIFNGQKMYCTLGVISPYIMLMTRDQKVENPYEGISMWLLPTDTPGVRFSKISKVGWWSIPTYEVHIQNARVPKSNLIGEMNKGWPQLMANFEIERLALCAASLGRSGRRLSRCRRICQSARAVWQTDWRLPGGAAHDHRYGGQDRKYEEFCVQDRLDDGPGHVCASRTRHVQAVCGSGFV